MGSACPVSPEPPEPADLCHLLPAKEVDPAWPFARQLLAEPGLLPKATCSFAQIVCFFLVQHWKGSRDNGVQDSQKGKDGREISGVGD